MDRHPDLFDMNVPAQHRDCTFEVEGISADSRGEKVLRMDKCVVGMVVGHVGWMCKEQGQRVE